MHVSETHSNNKFEPFLTTFVFSFISSGENRSCAFTDSFPYGYITECKQKFIYRHLLALDENGETVKNLFRLPACCKCVIRSRYSGNIFSRHASRSDFTKTDRPDITT